MKDFKIKIVVGIDEDGKDEERYVNLDQAIAFVRNQLEGLIQLRKEKEELDHTELEDMVKKIMEEAMKEIPKQPYIPSPPWQPQAPMIPTAPWVTPPYDGTGTTPWTPPIYWTTCGDLSIHSTSTGSDCDDNHYTLN